ncbi:MAG: hypothetical protein WBN89_07470 [Prochlorococcaceae cyanobacterium]
MNLVEVLVAGSLVLGSATGSLGIWARTAHSSHDAGQLLQQQRAADAALLTVQARLQTLAAQRRETPGPVPDVCPQPAELLPGLTLAVDGSGRIVTATAAAGGEHTRTRRFDLAVYGLCTSAGGQP